MHKLLACSKTLYDHDMALKIKQLRTLTKRNYKLNQIIQPTVTGDFETIEQWDNFRKERFKEFEKEVDELMRKEFIRREFVQYQREDEEYDEYMERVDGVDMFYLDVTGLKDIVYNLLFSLSKNEDWALEKASIIAGTIKGMCEALDSYSVLYDAFDEGNFNVVLGEECISNIISSTVRNLLDGAMKDTIYDLFCY
tara:strand:+ start:57 stop:644 length:588 start_codon:yes stop_codon:yes gene_type:complete